MNFPLELRFKLLAIAEQIQVTDASGGVVMYLRQKAFRLKEAVTVFGDADQREPLYRIAANRVLDFSAEYRIETASGEPVGSLRRSGMRSIWRAHYEVLRDEQVLFTIREVNPWVKLIDGVIGEVPVVGLLTGYFLHPTYRVASAAGDSELLRLEKRASLFESRYILSREHPLEPEDEPIAVLAVLMMVLLERSRG